MRKRSMKWWACDAGPRVESRASRRKESPADCASSRNQSSKRPQDFFACLHLRGTDLGTSLRQQFASKRTHQGHYAARLGVVCGSCAVGPFPLFGSLNGVQIWIFASLRAHAVLHDQSSKREVWTTPECLGKAWSFSHSFSHSRVFWGLKKRKRLIINSWYRWWDSNPHGDCSPTDFKSVASAISPHRRFNALTRFAALHYSDV